MKKHVRIISCILALVMMLALVACGDKSETAGTGATDAAAPAAPAELTENEILVVGVSSLPNGIDPEYHNSLEAMSLAANVYETLLDWDITTNENGTCVPDFDYTKIKGALAEKWWRSDDGKTIYFKLREGVLSNFGNELTAEDVKWRLDRADALDALGVFHMYDCTGLSSCENVHVEDKYTIAITTDDVSYIADIFYTHILCGIIDSTEAKKHITDADPWASDWLATNAATFGPYYIDEWTPGNQVVIVANPNYYGEAPAIKKIIYKEIPNSANRLAMLQSGDIDVFDSPLPEEVKQLQGVDGVKIEYHRSNKSLRIEPLCIDPILSNVKVRQALAYAFPYDEVLETVFLNNASPMTSIQADIYPFHEDTYNYTTDLEKAKALLEEAGYGDGFDVTISIDSAKADHERMCILFKTSLEKIGVNLNIEKLPTGDLYNKRLNYSLQLYVNEDMAGFPDPQFAVAMFSTAASGMNYNKFKDDELEVAYAGAKYSLDPQVREDAWHTMQVQFADNVGWIMICEPGFYLPVTTALSGGVWTPLNGFDFSHATLSR